MLRCLIVFSLVLSAAMSTSGGEARHAATMASPFGTVFVRATNEKPALPGYKQPVPKDQDLITLPAMRGVLEVSQGKVRLHLIGSVPTSAGGHALESIVKVHETAGQDLDFTLVRGRVLAENRQAKAPAKLQARLGTRIVKVELPPDGKVAFEQISYWPDGAPFPRKADKNHIPVQETRAMLLAGEATIEVDDERQTLQAPVLYRWSNVQRKVGPVPITTVPDWAAPPKKVSADVDALQKAGDKLRRLLEKKNSSLADAKTSDDAGVRTVVALGSTALDDVELAFSLLNKDKTKSVRDAAAAALRNFQGRGVAEDLRVFQAVTQANIKPGPATIFMELLHGMPESARDRPETFDALITYLQNDVQAIRHLAAGQLQRLAPKGKDIDYDAAAPAEQRAAAADAWRKRIAGKEPAPK